MKIQRVYIDTSVIGGCFDPEFATWSNGLMNDFEMGNFKGVSSEIVAAEIVSAPEFVRKKYAEFLATGPEMLAVNDEELSLLDSYQRHGVLSENFRNDMLHIALASIAEVDVLVSWNFRHIVHYDKIRQFNAVNLECGYKQLAIYSPREVTKYGED